MRTAAEADKVEASAKNALEKAKREFKYAETSKILAKAKEEKTKKTLEKVKNQMLRLFPEFFGENKVDGKISRSCKNDYNGNIKSHPVIFVSNRTKESVKNVHSPAVIDFARIA